ncbi:F-box domain-containing protein [Diplocarpon mali]|nr:F-box domain-containing protein [Diplocarpon mali]
MTQLRRLPNEIIHNVLRFLDPVDLVHLSKSCKFLCSNIKNDGQFYKAIYLRILVSHSARATPRAKIPRLMRIQDPPLVSSCSEFDYETELKQFVKYRRILEDHASPEKKAEDILFVTERTSSLLRTAQPDGQNYAFLRTYFTPPSTDQKLLNLNAFASLSTTFHRALKQPQSWKQQTPPPLETRQASAKLHVLYGKALLEPAHPKYQLLYPYAVSMVYDLRNYTEETLWGPYLADGHASVDWEKLEAAMLVLAHNTQQFHRSVGEDIANSVTTSASNSLTRRAWEGASPKSYKNLHLIGREVSEEEEERDNCEEDPFGIKGTWMRVRVVCFLDFHDFFAYNFNSAILSRRQPRPPLQTNEAIRFIIMQLSPTHTEPPGPDDGQALPVVHFEGISRSLYSPWDPNTNSKLKGNVRLTKEGEVRWQITSVYNGEERWCTEGIQIGGINSARGVLGHWFDKDHDPHGPAGPTTFYKVSEQIMLDPSAVLDEESGPPREEQFD